MTFDRFDQFDAYTDNTLPDPQRQLLESQLLTDPELRTQLTDYQQFRHSLEAVALKQQLERLHTRLDRQGALDTGRPALPLPPARFRRRPLVWVAAVLLLVAGSLYWVNRPNPVRQTFLAYYQPEPVARGGDCGPELNPGIRAYRTGAYDRALQTFRKLPGQPPCALYYTGLSHLALNQTPEAIAALEAVPLISYSGHGSIQSDPNPIDLTYQKAQWYLALAYLNANRTADARIRLNAIARQPNHPFQVVARRVLTNLGHE